MTYPLVHEINSDMILVGCVPVLTQSSYPRWPFKLWGRREKEINKEGPPRDTKGWHIFYFKHGQL